MSESALGTARTPRRILIVDDPEDLVETLARVLEIVGHTVESIKDGVHVVEVDERFRPVFVVMDGRNTGG